MKTMLCLRKFLGRLIWVLERIVIMISIKLRFRYFKVQVVYYRGTKVLYLNGLEGKKLEELLEYVLIQLRFFSVNFMK